MKTLFLVLVAAAILAIGVFHFRGHAADLVAQPAPTWTLPNLEGKSVSSAEFAGKVVVVDFWATWCPPCRAEIPGYVALQKKYADKVVFVGISLDQEGPGVVRDFVKANGINYRIVMGDEKVAEAFGGISGIPATFIIGKDGKIAFSKVGAMPEAKFEEALRKVL